jgi:hypothetical protein
MTLDNKLDGTQRGSGRDEEVKDRNANTRNKERNRWKERKTRKTT